MRIKAALTEYRETRSDSAFFILYEFIYDGHGNRKLIKVFSKKYRLDEQDVESMINEKIFEIVEKFEGESDKFKNLVYKAIKLGCIDLVRKKSYRESHLTEVMHENDDGIVSEVYELVQVAPTTGEAEIIQEITKKHDQRQLIAFLLSKADNSTLTSVSTFLKTDSYRQAAKLLGTDHKTVKSRIRKLSKEHRQTLFGNHYDFFTVPTVPAV